MALLLAAALTAQACAAPLCYPEAIAPFLDKLAARAPIHILQIGDSHTAGDMITQAWRVRLQARNGDGGRGMLAAGRPYAGYLTWGVTAFQSGGWSATASFGGKYREDGPPLGLAGFTQTAQEPGEMLGIAADSSDRPFDRMTVCAIMQPGAGTIMLRLAAAALRWPLNGPRRTPACRTLDSETPGLAAFVTTEDGGIVSITSIATFRRGGGAVLSNLGVSGAQFAHFDHSDDEAVRAELEAYRPDLIVLAYGTNEGFSPALTPDAYEEGLRAQIDRLRLLAGAEVPILLLGPPDGARHGAGESDCGDGWSVPPLLAAVRARQQAVAGEAGLAFWDWSAAMGGRCASSRWVAEGLMRGDHVHFTRSGGERIAAMLDSDLLAAARAASER